MLRGKSYSLRFKFFLGFLAVVLPALLLAFIMMFYVIERSIVPVAINNLHAVSEAGSTVISGVLDRALLDLRNLSTSATIQDAKASRDTKRKAMLRLQRLYPYFEDITLVDTDGKVVTSTSYAFRGVWKNKIWYTEALKGHTVVSNAYPMVKPFKVVLSMAMPVRDAHEDIRWVIVGQMNMERIWEFMDSFRFGENGHLIIITAEGQILADHSREKSLTFDVPKTLRSILLSKSSGATVIEGFEDPEDVIAFSTVALTGNVTYPAWRVLAIQSTSEIFADARRTQLVTSAVFAACIILCVILGFKLTGYVTKPLIRLTAHIHDIARSGDLDREVPVEGADEMGMLSKAFNDMSRKIRETNVSRDFVDHIINSMTDSLMVIDMGGDVKLANEHAVSLFWEDEGYDNSSIEMIFDEDEKKKAMDALGPLFEKGETVSFECKCVSGHGRKFQADVMGASLKGEEVAGGAFIITIHDISERKKSEELVKDKLTEIRTLNEFMVDRELRAIELKKEVNELLRELGRDSKYSI